MKISKFLSYLITNKNCSGCMFQIHCEKTREKNNPWKDNFFDKYCYQSRCNISNSMHKVYLHRRGIGTECEESPDGWHKWRHLHAHEWCCEYCSMGAYVDYVNKGIRKEYERQEKIWG